MNNISKYNFNNDCCGCMACLNVCPFDAIDVTCNERGFFIPKVNTEKCKNCGKCERVCQIKNSVIGNTPFQRYAIINEDDTIRHDSSSGGVFWMIIHDMFSLYKEHFHCAGVLFDDELNVIYSVANSIDECTSFRGSKYVQAKIEKTYSDISKLLISGDIVLFVGTGCQCAGLKNYINTQKVNTDNLFMIDIICHGMPSQKLWKDYIEAVQNTCSQKIVSYKFRDKKYGWRGMHPTAITSTGEMIERDGLFSSYCRCFGNLSLNSVCYSCKYANLNRVGDLTLGDYWGIEKSACPFDDNKGVSICLVNNSKGQKMFGNFLSKAKVYEINDDSYLQPQLCYPTKKNVLSEDFWRDYTRYGYVYVAKKYASANKFSRIRRKIFAYVKHLF